MSDVTASITRATRRKLGMNQTQFAELFGVDQSTVSRWENGADMVPEHYSALIVMAEEHHAYGPSSTLPSHEIANTVPVIGHVGAGAAVFLIEGDEPIDFTEPPRADMDMMAAVVRGDSMYPLYRDGDTIYFRGFSDAPTRLVGEECLVRTDEGGLFIKILERGTNGRFNLISYNAPPLRDQLVVEAAPVAYIKRRRYA